MGHFNASRGATLRPSSRKNNSNEGSFSSQEQLSKLNEKVRIFAGYSFTCVGKWASWCRFIITIEGTKNRDHTRLLLITIFLFFLRVDRLGQCCPATRPKPRSNRLLRKNESCKEDKRARHGPTQTWCLSLDHGHATENAQLYADLTGW